MVIQEETSGTRVSTIIFYEEDDLYVRISRRIFPTNIVFDKRVKRDLMDFSVQVQTWVNLQTPDYSKIVVRAKTYPAYGSLAR